MDGVSLAESLLYKDYDELQRLIKACNVIDNHDAISEIKPPPNEDRCMCSVSDSYREFQIDPFSPVGGKVKSPSYAIVTNALDRVKPDHHEIKSLLCDPTSRNLESEPLNVIQGLINGSIQAHKVVANNDNQVHQNDFSYGTDNEIKSPPYQISEKPQGSYIYTNSVSPGTDDPQQTMVSTFKLNAVLPIINSDFPGTSSLGFKVGNNNDQKYIGIDPNILKSRLHCSKESACTLSSSKINLNKRNSNAIITTFSQSDQNARMSSLSCYCEKLYNVPFFQTSVAPERSSQPFPGNQIDGNKHRKISQQTKHESTILHEAKQDSSTMNGLRLDQNEVITETSRAGYDRQSSEKSTLQRSSFQPQITGFAANTPFLLPRPYISSDISGTMNKQIPQISTGIQECLRINRSTSKVHCSTHRISGDLGGFQCLKSGIYNEKSPLDVFKVSDQVLRQITPMESVGTADYSSSLNSTDNISTKSIPGSSLPLEQMREQHSCLTNDIDKIINYFAVYFKNPESFSMLEIGRNTHGDMHGWLEEEQLALHNSYEKINNLVGLLDKLRSGSVPRVVYKVLDELLGSIRKLKAITCNFGDATGARDRNLEENFVSPRFDWSTNGQILRELAGRLRQMRTALWACVQLFNWNGTSNYAQTVQCLAEVSSRGSLAQAVATNYSKLSQVPPLVNIVKPLKSVARPLMDVQSQMDGIQFSPIVTATAAPVHQIHNNSNNNNQNQNNPQGLLLLPGTVNTAGLCWSQRSMHASSARPIFTQSAQYLPDQVIIPEAGLFTSDLNGTVQPSGILFPHPTVQPGQPTLIMPSTLFTSNFNRNSGLGPQLCRFQPNNRYSDRL
ncbi:hypothetical protein FGIG_10143 [Fasciola gigantica]|uniref:Uncharacterized protein n=1 Tax=Fasciola gigantica TaxID=46835 RepID=A0A504YN03_FASGI|nr:hypothetical protein FGIG_10143 [Fasciola gigantica]